MPKAVTARIDKLLSSMGYGSRSEIGRLARAGRITLDGEKPVDVTSRITVDADLPARLSVDDAPLDPVAGMVILMNKPTGVTCSHSEAGPLVYGLLPPRWRQRDPVLSTVGRLDKETSGLLLLTDDGALLHRIISPRRKVSKTYRATLARPLNGDEAALFASGDLMLKGETKPLDPAVLDILSPTEALLTITEGRYHQVRRMFAACGNHVEALHRERLGQLRLPEDLEAGAWRLLGEEDQQRVFLQDGPG
ncbi:16S rRNA pseudouridine(516) synthase [Pseudomonas sp. GX19020]|uniref:pseudouridine synthase n=1 Tax=Pseudomonas sp. GX19020 TaxID=2942277 RepID=UPI00201935B2|nr:16S rRNA pseudouridine(516) synthase [Pseudomonas sp. GX19020]MCL4067913.1 16S rRNA pseudouridine(516) synthase [Pseudomonas sp. GX19020]